MADKPKRRLRPPQSVRERAEAALEPQPPKKKRLSGFKHKAASPFKRLGSILSRYKTFQIIAKILKFIGKILWPEYLRSSWREIKLVTWPGWHESLRLTVAVIGFAVVIGAFVASLDYGLSHLFKLIILGKHH